MGVKVRLEHILNNAKERLPKPCLTKVTIKRLGTFMLVAIQDEESAGPWRNVHLKHAPGTNPYTPTPQLISHQSAFKACTLFQGRTVLLLCILPKPKGRAIYGNMEKLQCLNTCLWGSSKWGIKLGSGNETHAQTSSSGTARFRYRIPKSQEF